MTAQTVLSARQARKAKLRGAMLGLGIAGGIVLLVVAATVLAIVNRPTFSGRGGFTSVHFRAAKGWTWDWECSGVQPGDASEVFWCIPMGGGKELGGAKNRARYTSKPLPAGVYCFTVVDDHYRKWSITVHGLQEMNVREKPAPAQK